MRCRGVRGATTVAANSREAVREATQELLAEMVRENGIRPDDIASATFTTTPDLNAEFPAVVARERFGWTNVAMLCGHEIAVPGSLPQCLRVMVLVNTEKRPDQIVHIYIRGATVLRPDLAKARAGSALPS